MKSHRGKKAFDCIEFKRAAQARIYERIKGLSALEEIDYFRSAAEDGPLGEGWKAICRQSRATTPASPTIE